MEPARGEHGEHGRHVQDRDDPVRTAREIVDKVALEHPWGLRGLTTKSHRLHSFPCFLHSHGSACRAPLATPTTSATGFVGEIAPTRRPRVGPAPQVCPVFVPIFTDSALVCPQ